MNLLEECFDIAFAAPDGIKKLRQLILTLAMQGKLVPQDPNDQPASELLKEIELEKKRLVKDGKIKQPKLLPEIELEKLPCTLPQTWEWIRLGQAGEINPRNTCDDNIDAGFVPMPLIGAEYGSPHKFEIRKWKEIKKGFTHFADKDVALAKITPCFENGKSCVFNGLPNGIGAGTTELHIFRNTFHAVCPEYLLAYLKNPKYIASGIANMTGSAGQKRVPTDFFKLNPFPLPPLAEQRRIVAKIDQLMARCDELEKLKNDRSQRLTTVHTAALNRLLTAKESSDFDDAWKFIAQHFSEFYSVKENVAELRKAILQLAVMGKLVPQDPNDEPVDNLLRKILIERKQLKLGSLNENQFLERLEYDIPEHWKWQSLNSILVSGPTNGFSPKAVDYETPVRSLTLSATTSGKFKEEHSKFIANKIPPDSNLWLQDGDILVQRGNSLEYVGVPAVYRGGSNRFIYPDLMIKIRVSLEIDTDFIYLVMSSEPCRDFLRSRASGTSGTMPKINQTILKSLPIPIPPLAEQHRIVAKIDQLVALCDQLEQQIDATKAKQTDLLNAMMSQV